APAPRRLDHRHHRPAGGRGGRPLCSPADGRAGPAVTSLSCPVCRVHLPADGTHCPRCGLRVAALPRRGPVTAADADADPAAAAAAGGVDWHWVGARGGAAGAAIVLAALVVGLAVGVPRRQFLTVVDHAAT